MRRGFFAICLITAGLPPTVVAQRPIRVAVMASHLDHRVEAGFGPERSSGLVFGGDVRVGVARNIAVAAAGSAGHLDARAGDAMDRDVAQLSLGAEALPLTWLVIDAGVTLRNYSTVLARQRWTLWRAGAEARVPFSGGRVHAVGRFGLYPWASANGLPRATLAVESAVGLSYASGPWGLDLRYAFERCDFSPSGSGERIEQLSGLVVRAGWAMPR